MADYFTELECANCGIAISWTPIWMKGESFCCIGCAMGGPCTCSYDELTKGENMKMILAIVQDEDVGTLMDKLAERGQRATKISSTGGFLRSGNTTLLMGAEDTAVQGVLDMIRITCKTRKQVSNTIPALSAGLASTMMPDPVEVEVGGANVFVWDVEQYVRV